MQITSVLILHVAGTTLLCSEFKIIEQSKLEDNDDCEIIILSVLFSPLLLAYGTRRSNATFKDSPITPILKRINPVSHIHAYFLKLYYNILFKSMPRHSYWSLPVRFFSFFFIPYHL